jgi:hypothetical protein
MKKRREVISNEDASAATPTIWAIQRALSIPWGWAKRVKTGAAGSRRHPGKEGEKTSETSCARHGETDNFKQALQPCRRP